MGVVSASLLKFVHTHLQVVLKFRILISSGYGIVFNPNVPIELHVQHSENFAKK